MANIQISQFPDSVNAQSADIFPIVRGGINYKTNIGYLVPFLGFANLVSGFSLTQGTVPATLTVSGNSTINQNVSTNASPTFATLNTTTINNAGDITTAGLSAFNINSSTFINANTAYFASSVNVLNTTTLGATVVNSSLTKVGLSVAGYVKTDVLGNLSSQTFVPISDLQQPAMTGNIYYGNGNSFASLPIGSNGFFLSVISGIPAWINAPPVSIPNPLVLGNITIDGTSNNVISSIFAGSFTIAAPTNRSLVLRSNNIINTNNPTISSDKGAIYLTGTNVNATNTGTAFTGRTTIVAGLVTITPTSATIIQTGGVIVCLRQGVGQVSLTWDVNLFIQDPYIVTTYIGVTGGFTSQATPSVINTNTALINVTVNNVPTDNVTFSFMVIGTT